MPRTKISEFSSTAGSNTDIDGINIAEGCSPSGINDAIRELMAQLKDFQAGTAGDSFNGPVGTTTAAAGAFTTLSASSTVSGAGFSTYLASPPAIGGTAAAAGSFTTLTTSSTVTHNGGTANGVAYLNGSKVLTTGSALTFDGTNFNVVRAAAADQYMSMYADGTGPTLKFFGGAAGKIAGIVADSASASMYFTNEGNKPFVYAINGSEQMRLTSTGLGIGTSSPSVKLDVVGAINATSNITSGGVLQALTTVQSSSGADLSLNANGANRDIIYKVNATELMRLVGSSGNLGIGTSSPAGILHLKGADPIQYFEDSSGTTSYCSIQNANGVLDLQADNTATVASSAIKFSVDSVEGMRLTPTGLGIGTSSPSAKLHVDSGSTGLMGLLNSTNANGGYITGRSSGSDIWDLGTAKQALNVGGSTDFGINVRNGFLSLGTGNTERMRLDSSGNLGLGVTPSAWGGSYKAFNIVGSGSLFSNNQFNTRVGNNLYHNGTNFIYNATGFATYYSQNDAAGTHAWYTAPSGTAGNAITFTQAMTLDASGNLLVGKTSSTGLGTQNIEVSNSSSSTVAIKGGSNEWSMLVSSSSDSLRFYEDSTERARITSGGDLLVGTTSATGKVTVSTSGNTYGVYSENTNTASTSNYLFWGYGNAASRFIVYGNGGIANYQANDVNLSDRREKTNFAPAKAYIDAICAIPVQTFNYVDQSEDDPRLTLGVVAQDVQAVAPELVMESNWGTKDEPKMRLSIYQTDLQYALMKCIQEQQVMINELKAKVAALEAK